jgi:hypothetical protein
MVKVTYSPNSEMIIHDILEQENNGFFEDIVRQTLASPAHVEPTVNWFDGIAFLVASMPQTEDIVKENLAGRVHFAAVLFTRIPYKNQVPVKLGNQDFSVHLRRADHNKMWVDLVNFLKQFKG